jgi:hypothetical protein
MSTRLWLIEIYENNITLKIEKVGGEIPLIF